MDGRGSRILLTLVAIVAVALAAGCNQQARAQSGASSNAGPELESKAQPAATAPNTPAESSSHAPSSKPTNPDQPGLAPEGSDQIPAEPDRANTPQPAQSDDTDTADAPPAEPEGLDDGQQRDGEDGQNNTDDDELDEDNLHIPNRGSGGDNPPDYIAPSEHKLVDRLTVPDTA